MQISANHLLSLINDVLQMSKLEEGTTVLTHERISLVELTRDIITIIIGRAEEAGIEWEYEKDKSIIPDVYKRQLLHGAFVWAPVPHAKINAVDYSAAEQAEGVVRIVTAADVPGMNKVGTWRCV